MVFPEETIRAAFIRSAREGHFSAALWLNQLGPDSQPKPAAYLRYHRDEYAGKVLFKASRAMC